MKIMQHNQNFLEIQYGTKSLLQREVLASGIWYGYVGRRTIWLWETVTGGIRFVPRSDAGSFYFLY